MSVYKVEKGVAIPSPSWGKHLAKYPFGEMAIGDSFLTSADDRDRVRNAAHVYGSRHSIKFISRAEGDGVRVWRVA